MGITTQGGLVMAAFVHYNLYFLIYVDSEIQVLLNSTSQQMLLLKVLFHLSGKIRKTVTDASISGSHIMGYIETQGECSLITGETSLRFLFSLFFKSICFENIQFPSSMHRISSRNH